MDRGNAGVVSSCSCPGKALIFERYPLVGFRGSGPKQLLCSPRRGPRRGAGVLVHRWHRPGYRGLATEQLFLNVTKERKMSSGREETETDGGTEEREEECEAPETRGR